MGNEIVLTEIADEYEALIQEVRELKILSAALEAEKDDLELNVCRKLRAEYDSKVGNLELEITRYNLEIERLRSIISSMQAAVNRASKITPEEAEKEADEKLKDFYDELGKRAEQARKDQEFAQKRAEQEKENAKNAEYDENEPEYEEYEFNWDEFFSTMNDFSKMFEEFMKSFRGFNGNDYSHTESFDQGSSAKKNVNPAKELKRLYRKVVKALHPDNKKNRTPKDDELLMEAKKAFEDGNIDRLREIAEMIEDEEVDKRFKDTPEDIEALKELRQKLRSHMMSLERDVKQIKNSFPYNQKDFLADDEAVAARQNELNNIKESCCNTITALKERIDLLQKQMES